ncbi:MAG: GNAT family N-acetyltransferase [Planctomycetota bacterium]
MPNRSSPERKRMSYTESIIWSVGPECLLKAIEENHWESQKILAKELIEFPGGFCVLSGSQEAWLNSIFLTDADKSLLPAFIPGAIARLRRCNLPMVWDISPRQYSAELHRCLENQGIHLVSITQGMAMDLETLVEPSFGTGIRIETVQDTRTLHEWSSILDMSFGGSGCAPGCAFEMHYGGKGVGPNNPWQHFVALNEDCPVGSGSLFLGAGVVGIPCMGTLPTAGKKGVATSLTLSLLSESRRRGFHVAVLYSSEAAEKMYTRIGFSAFGKRYQFLWHPAES